MESLEEIVRSGKSLPMIDEGIEKSESVDKDDFKDTKAAGSSRGRTRPLMEAGESVTAFDSCDGDECRLCFSQALYPTHTSGITNMSTESIVNEVSW